MDIAGIRSSFFGLKNGRKSANEKWLFSETKPVLTLKIGLEEP